ncbi:MSHA biogenesis protein MshN [Vibrio caribbeanicus]|uniref:MSHA biogenesis protein MshN n=1 Tax=Vibrio caribbeanicus TaxID=701175 RepID=A0ACC4NTN3_9VIBR|nr:tetratricopeptide repeat protein [Vibrio caribbeanicus]KHD23764.1 MSHA biogenesis protein MshN [Vibrio caribbeanicus]
MSAINQALSELARKKGGKLSEIEQIRVSPVKQRSVVPWVVGTFAISLGVGGWAISYQQPSQIEQVASEPSSVFNDSVATNSHVPSPTAKATTQGGTIYRSEVPRFPSTISETDQASPLVATSQPVVALAQVESSSQPKVTGNKSEQVSSKANSGDIVIQQVELTAEQLSNNAQKRAQKALDSNNLDEALANYSEALKYTPYDTKVRQTLSALYYGKGDVRRAGELLQKGISLDKESVVLRLALAKLLMKEKQNAAALTALSALPEEANVEYLSLRGVLAQQNNQNEMALSSYLKLVEIEPESGRWWLGLAIQQERVLEFEQAQQSYNKALAGFGLSGQSQQFIHDRLALIKQLGESK